jgi:hypothetical protein
MVSWRFGNAGDRYPIEVGDIVKVGPHILACGDIEMGAGEELIEQCWLPDIMYCSPPWNVKQYRLDRLKGDVPGGDYEMFLDDLVELSQTAEKHSFLMCGSREYEDLDLRLGETYTTPGVLNRYNINGLTSSQQLLFHIDKKLEGEGYSRKLDWADEEFAPYIVARTFGTKNDIMFDPCMTGHASMEAAETHDKRFIGIDLIPRRLSTLIERFVRRGYDWEIIGKLDSMEGVSYG